MRGLGSGTPTASQQQQQQQQQVEMQKMQGQQPPLMNQQQQYQQQQPNLYRNPGANQSTRPTRPIMTPYGHTAAPFFAPFIQMPYSRIPGHQWNYGSMPGMASAYPPQYYIQSAPILAQGQHQQTRRNPAGDNSGLVNMQQVPLPQPQPPNQQSSPMTVSHDLLVMQQLQHPQQQQPPQQTPQQVTGGGQAPMDQHQPNPAQVSVGGPQPPPNALMSQIQLASHLAATGAAPVPPNR